MKTKIGLTLMIFYYGLFSSQKCQPIYYADYSYANRNQIRAGLEWFLSEPEKDDKLFLGTGFNAVYHNEKIYVLPDFHLSYNPKSGYFLKAGSSFFHTYMLGGISLFNILDLGMGYSLSHQKEKIPIKGFTVGLTIRLTNNNNAYGKMKIGF